MIYYANLLSPSMRRVWIEIFELQSNFSYHRSPSMRRVWIEISLACALGRHPLVTLHAEGVD